MTKPFEVWQDVYAIGGPELTHDYDCCVYLVGQPDEMVMIDCGAGRSFKELVANVKSLGFDPKCLKSLIATHAHIDHIGALADFRRVFKLKVFAHELDAAGIETGKGIGAEAYGVRYTPCPVDVKVRQAEHEVPCGKHTIKCAHIPGHTRGSMAAYIDIAGKRVLFGQDIHGPYVAQWGADMPNVRGSLQKLIDLKPDILCEGHFGVYQPNSAVESYIRSYLRDFER